MRYVDKGMQKYVDKMLLKHVNKLRTSLAVKSEKQRPCAEKKMGKR